MDENGCSFEEESEEYILSQLRQTFREEAAELLAEIEAALLELEKAPLDREVIDRLFRALHTMKGSGLTCEFIDISSFAHQLENFIDLLRKGEARAGGEFIALALAAQDRLSEMLDAHYGAPPAAGDLEKEIIAAFTELLGRDQRNDPVPLTPSVNPSLSPPSRQIPKKSDSGANPDEEDEWKKLGEILVERGDLAPEAVEKVLSAQKRFGEICVESDLVTPDRVKSALDEQQKIREMRRESRKAEEMASIRVSVEKLDALSSIVGELVTIQAHLTQTAALRGLPEFQAIAEQVERISGSLHESTMSIRMVPIEKMFGRFRRLVRDLGRDTGKSIELVTEGGETELDKTVIELLSDPLLHIIRNSVDHGIERPPAREKAGKPPTGTIRLSASHSGGHVLIRICDDGAGLDREAIHARGVERGLIPPRAELADEELFSLIFLPGFSTANEVSDISGRGVGLDVVKKAIDSLHCTMEIESRRGEGTAITLRLPLTLAIIDGLLVRIGKEAFILPLSFVRECVELVRNESKGGNGRRIANVRGDIVPYIDLRELFAVGGEAPPIEQIVITEASGSRVGLVVDEVVGGQQTVIKNLGRVYRNVEGISGATILGAGNVALILDVPGLVRFAEQEESRSCSCSH